MLIPWRSPQVPWIPWPHWARISHQEAADDRRRRREEVKRRATEALRRKAQKGLRLEILEDEAGTPRGEDWRRLMSKAPARKTRTGPMSAQVDIPQHLAALQAMMIDWKLDRHLLLIGNQGVGKNKLADRFLGMLGLEREYLQLHRDTTVQSLTVQPTLDNGVVRYQDSPLVSAVRHGRVLVIDEADKAPLEVVCILKSLAEDGDLAV
eukprot:Skav205684  [mRNA]  locus=scaffold2655:21060:22155:- [translate_table: standard]